MSVSVMILNTKREKVFCTQILSPHWYQESVLNCLTIASAALEGMSFLSLTLREWRNLTIVWAVTFAVPWRVCKGTQILGSKSESNHQKFKKSSFKWDVESGVVMTGRMSGTDTVHRFFSLFLSPDYIYGTDTFVCQLFLSENLYCHYTVSQWSFVHVPLLTHWCAYAETDCGKQVLLCSVWHIGVRMTGKLTL